MIGWRGRIGVLLPPDNAVLEYETNRLPLPGISFHVARLFSRKLEELPEESLKHIPSLQECGVNFILYACAASSFMFGAGANAKLEQEIRARSGLGAATATGALVQSVKALGIRRVALATPYWKELDDKLLAYFAEGEVRVVKIESMRLDTWQAMNNQTPAGVYPLVRRADHPDAESILILSTNLPTLSIIQSLEDDLKKPVISTNQAMIWAALRGLKIREPISGLGRLLES